MIKTYPYFCHHLHALTGDIMLLVFIPQSSSRIHYQAGQYVEALFDDGMVLPLSIANSENTEGKLEFHLRHNAQHLLASQFLKSLQNNKLVTLRGPLGNCTLTHAHVAQNIILLAERFVLNKARTSNYNLTIVY